jgi:hypothetical protein
VSPDQISLLARFVRACLRLTDTVYLLMPRVPGCKPANILFRMPDMQRQIQEEMEAAPSPKRYYSAKIQPIGMNLWRNPEKQRDFFKNAVVVMTDFGRCKSSDMRALSLSFEVV